MKRLFLIFILFNFHTLLAQSLSIAVLSSPDVSNYSSAELDSLTNYINYKSNADLIILIGNLIDDYQSVTKIKTFSDKINKDLLFLPSARNLSKINSILTMPEIFNDRFDLKLDKFFLLGTSPLIPFKNYRHISGEFFNWLSETLDTISLSEEIYLFLPEPVNNLADNWKEMLKIISSKNLKLIVCGNSSRTELNNIYGYPVLNLENFKSVKSNKWELPEIQITKDSIIIQYGKLLEVIDKTIELTKEKIEIDTNSLPDSTIVFKAYLENDLYSRPIYYNNKLFIADASGILTCRDTNGDILWDYDLNGDIHGSITMADRTINAVTFQGDLQSVSLTGEQFQSIGFNEYITTSLLPIDYEGNKELMIPKVTKSKKALVFGTNEGKVYCYDLETLQEYWVNDISDDAINDNLIIHDNKIFYTSDDGFLYCIDARTGLFIWRWKYKKGIELSNSELIITSNSIFAVADDGQLFCIDYLLGKLNWYRDKYKLRKELSLSSDGKYLFSFNDEKILVFAVNTGNIIKEIKLDQKINFHAFPPLYLNDNMYILAVDGIIYVWDGNKKIKRIFSSGNAPILSMSVLNDSNILISTTDGLIFNLNLNKLVNWNEKF
ncbi:outer membrane protein assembly factor BamB family protein [Melioribacter sp. OK-6-Me]|uniref:outer membrane protein assembly factor BamB family protein n=1 Tax=unclassified Melioribacter TaxID=2627329 RepID=UPI003ED9212D